MGAVELSSNPHFSSLSLLLLLFLLPHFSTLPVADSDLFEPAAAAAAASPRLVCLQKPLPLTSTVRIDPPPPKPLLLPPPPPSISSPSAIASRSDSLLSLSFSLQVLVRLDVLSSRYRDVTAKLDRLESVLCFVKILKRSFDSSLSLSRSFFTFLVRLDILSCRYRDITAKFDRLESVLCSCWRF